MRITAIVKPNASVNKVIPVDESTYRVFTIASPEKGRANQTVLKLLAEHLDIASSRLSLRFGATAHEKSIEVSET